jgi:glyoxylase-like metal-dependent hydrolase (beta-lactamase superfamily II)
MTIFNLGNRVVNNYLISSEDGYILIDTGYAGGFPRFIKQLRKNGIDPKEISYVFLTHAHDDHAGFLNEVLEITGAQVILHPEAIEGLKRGQNAFKGGCSSRVAWLFCQVLALFGHGDHRYPVIDSGYMNRLIPIDSERFRALQFPYIVLETPGHTADHITLLAGDVLFCGDAAINGFPSRRRIIIWIEDLEQYRQSWERIIEAPPRILYPGHGKPFQTTDLKLLILEGIRLYPLKHCSE